MLMGSNVPANVGNVPKYTKTSPKTFLTADETLREQRRLARKRYNDKLASRRNVTSLSEKGVNVIVNQVGVPLNVTAAESMADWLGQTLWQRFVTFTTPYTLTLPSARRLNERYMDWLKRLLPGEPLRLFWCAERFECKDGYHTHGLLYYSEDSFVTRGLDALPILDQGYQVVSGAARTGKRYRASFNRYNPRQAGARYCSKYLLKKYADYDLLINN